jgi:16S rRNA (guanine1207-N2)-methyltransferase
LKANTPIELCSDYTSYQRAVSAHGAVQFGAWYERPADLHDLAIVFLPKSRLLIEMTLTMVAGAVHAGGSVLLVGENNAGIRSSRAPLEALVGEVTFSDSARRCIAYLAKRGLNTPPRGCIGDWVEEYFPVVRGDSLTVATLPGVFNHGRLDGGTQLLLEHLVVPESASRVLDVGCGSGVIGLAVKRQCPGTMVDMVDTSAYALEASRRTVDLNGLSGVNVFPSDVFSAVTGRYALIVSNPPFHSGVRTDYTAAEAFFRGARGCLEPGGTVVVVINRFLPYLPLIEQHIGPPRILAEDNRYRVIRAG